MVIREGIGIHEIREDDHVLELRGEPYQIQRILLHAHFVGEGRGIVGAQPGTAVGVDANAEIAYASLQMRTSHDVRYGVIHIVVDLCCVGHCHVVLIIER